MDLHCFNSDEPNLPSFLSARNGPEWFALLKAAAGDDYPDLLGIEFWQYLAEINGVEMDSDD